MKRIKSSYRNLAILMAITTFGACHKLCQSGYEGKNCNTEVRAAFEGAWTAVDSPGQLKYTDTISAGSYVSNILISSAFSNHYFSNPITATVNGNTATIVQQAPNSNMYYVSGTGTINTTGTQINWTYQITNNTDSPAIVNNFTGVWSK